MRERTKRRLSDKLRTIKEQLTLIAKSYEAEENDAIQELESYEQQAAEIEEAAEDAQAEARY